MPARIAFPIASSRMRHALAGLALLAGLVGWGIWQSDQDGARHNPGVVVQPEDDVCIVAPPTPYNPASGLAMEAARPVPPDVRCPVCGMYPARFPDWAAQVIFDNGDAQFFDSPLSLFMYLRDTGRYSPGRHAHQVIARYVTDVTTKRWIDATRAWYVEGSDARGPMRAGNLPAFGAQDEAAQFALRRGGRVVAFSDVDKHLIDTLAGSGGHQAHTGRTQAMQAR